MIRDENYLIVVAGPTASGKTAWSIALANHFNAPIVSADSRQFYKEMTIGTAKPNSEELDAAQHYFVNNLSVVDDYSVGQFEKEVIHFLETHFKTHNKAILSGGTNLFVNAICEGIDDFPDSPPEYRVQLNAEFKESGLDNLLIELQQKDPDYFKIVDQQNPQRIIRALEVIRSSGEPFSALRSGVKTERAFKIIKVAPKWERKALYDRINRRVDLMLEEGLEEEARLLYKFRELNALQTVGYKEFFAFFDGEIDRKEAVRLIKRNSRRYAKRQLTWLRKDTSIQWLEPSDISTVIDYIESQISIV